MNKKRGGELNEITKWINEVQLMRTEHDKTKAELEQMKDLARDLLAELREKYLDEPGRDPYCRTLIKCAEEELK